MYNNDKQILCNLSLITLRLFSTLNESNRSVISCRLVTADVFCPDIKMLFILTFGKLAILTKNFKLKTLHLSKDLYKSLIYQNN